MLSKVAFTGVFLVVAAFVACGGEIVDSGGNSPDAGTPSSGNSTSAKASSSSSSSSSSGGSGDTTSGACGGCTPCGPNYQAVIHKGDCCATCELIATADSGSPPPEDTCVAEGAGYPDWLAARLAEPGTEDCNTAADCAIVPTANTCRSDCGSIVAAAAAQSVTSDVAAYGAEHCPNCPEQFLGCPVGIVPIPVCKDNKCVAPSP